MSDDRGRPRRAGGSTPPARIDVALDAMLRRLAVVMQDIGEDTAADVLASLAVAEEPKHADGGVLGLPHGAPQPIDKLVAALQLSPTDRDLLVLSLLGQRNAQAAGALRRLNPSGRPLVTLGLVVELAERGLVAGVSSLPGTQSALARSALIRSGAARIEDSGPWTERGLLPGELIWEAAIGLGGWPPGMTVDRLPAPIWGLDDWLDDPVTAGARRAIEAKVPSAFGAFSDRPDAAAARLAALVSVAGATPVLLRSPELDSATVQLAVILAAMRDVVPVFCETGDAAQYLELSVSYLPMPLLVARRSSAVTAFPRPLISLPVGALSVHDRGAAMRAAVPGLDLADGVCPASAEPRDLALAAFDLKGQQELVRMSSPDASLEVFVGAVDRRVASTVPEGGTLVHPRMSWNDLVLDEDRLTMLREAVSRAQIQADWSARGLLPSPRRGERGLRMMFIGPPGTGKTLAAEVIAHALGRDLLVVSLSQLVSKWIGETEKNLEGVFQAAERGDTVLFLDEADALLAKRTQVEDARDRYANLETAYLLARIEAFEGVVVLSTNMRRNIDTALTRRLEFIVPFELPGVAARRELWLLHRPSWATVSDDVDFDDLASLYDLPGALIRNASLAAGYLAAAGRINDPSGGIGPPKITTQHLVHAIQREHAKAGLAFPGAPQILHAIPSRRTTPTAKSSSRSELRALSAAALKHDSQRSQP